MGKDDRHRPARLGGGQHPRASRFCALGDAAAMPVQGALKHFRDEFEHHVTHKTCRVNRRRAEVAEVARLSGRVRVTIDGRTVEVPAGTLVTDAARAAEVHVPIFCSHQKLPPLGACRICVVEVGHAEARARPQARARARRHAGDRLDAQGADGLHDGRLATACTCARAAEVATARRARA